MKYISDILQIAIEETCKMKKVIHKSKIPWSKELDILKKEARSTRCRTSREEAEKNYRSAIRNVEREIHKGCPQGGILSPLLWNFTLNTLLDRYDLDRDSIICYADDMAIIISSFDLNATMRPIAIRYLKTIDKWCTANGVKLSATKTQLILFRTKNKKFKLDPIVIRGQTLHLTDEVTYLGVILDKYLSCTPHITAKTIVANKKLKMTKALIGKEWGLEPKALRYIYNDVIFPGLSYACFVWQHKCLSNKSIT